MKDFFELTPDRQRCLFVFAVIASIWAVGYYVEHGSGYSEAVEIRNQLQR